MTTVSRDVNKQYAMFERWNNRNLPPFQSIGRNVPLSSDDKDDPTDMSTEDVKESGKMEIFPHNKIIIMITIILQTSKFPSCHF